VTGPSAAPGTGRPPAALGRRRLDRDRRRRRRRRRLRADLEGLAQLAQPALLVVAEARVDLERLQERRAAQQAHLVDDDELRQLLGQRAREHLDRVVGQARVLEHRLAQLALRALGHHPAEHARGRLPVAPDRQHLLDRLREQRGGGGLAHVRLGVLQQQVQQLDQVRGLERQRALGRQQTQVGRDAAPAELVHQRVRGPAVVHRRSRVMPEAPGRPAAMTARSAV
jgi:hypothetical protein